MNALSNNGVDGRALQADGGVLVLPSGFPATPSDTKLTFMADEVEALARLGTRLDVVIPNATTCAYDGVRFHTVGGTGARPGAVAKVVWFGLRRRDLLPMTPLGKWYRAARKNWLVARLARKTGSRIVRSHFGWPDGTGGVAGAKEADLPCVVTLRGFDVLLLDDIGYGGRLDPFFNRALAASLSGADRVTVASSTTRDAAVALGCPERSLVVIPNGVAIEEFSPKAEPSVRRRMGLSPEEIVFLLVGGLTSRKRQIDMVEAAGKLPADFGPLRIVMGGEGGEREAILKRAQELGLSARLVLAGSVPHKEMPAVFRACDVFVQTSVAEGFGNVVLEAGACGKAMVATNTGAVKDLMVDGENALVYEAGDIDALVRALVAVRSDALRASLGAKARKVAERFSMDARARGFQELYRELLAERSQGGNSHAE